ncbi:MAG: efflux RND transporter periplasmic adaptor subunit [Myxococcota bacterium]
MHIHLSSVVLLAAGCGSPGPAAADRPIFEVEAGVITERAEASGTIQPNVQVVVGARASGEVVEVLIEVGETVEAGQSLFRLDARDADRGFQDAQVNLKRARADLAQAQANLRMAETQAKNARLDLAVATQGAERGLVTKESRRAEAMDAEVSEATVAVRRAAVQAALASVAGARLAVQDAEQRRSEMNVAAPVTGTVLDVAVERGSIVASALANVSGGTAMATVADLGDLRVVGQIDEAQIGKVAVGQSVDIRVDAYPDDLFAGRVHRVAPLGEAESNVVTFDVEIVVTDDKASQLRSGMSADLSIAVGRKNGIVVPLVAVRSESGQRYVELDSGETRAIRTGPTDGEHLIVTDGLEPGDRIRMMTVTVPPERSGGLFGPPRRRGGRRGPPP